MNPIGIDDHISTSINDIYTFFTDLYRYFNFNPQNIKTEFPIFPD